MASVSKRRWKKPDGSTGETWVVRHIDRDGKHRQKTFDKKKEADKYRTSVEAEIVERGFATHINGATVAAVTDLFLKEQESRVDDGDIGKSRFNRIMMAATKSILPHLGKMIAKDLTAQDVERWYQDLRQGGLSARTARDRVRELSLVLSYAERHRYCVGNVASKAMKGGLHRRPTKIVRTFSQEQIAALLAAAEQRFPGQHERSHHMLRVVVHLAAFCGLRWGEIYGLPLGRINLAERVIEVRHSLTEFDQLKGPKTAAGNRDVPMPKHIADMLAVWIEQFYFPNDRELLFRVGTAEAPRMLSAANFHMCHWRKLLDRAGLGNADDHLHFHALRHFASSWWIMNGLPLPDTAAMLGHAKFDITLQVYAHGIVGGQRKTEIADRMADRLLMFEAQDCASGKAPVTQQLRIGAQPQLSCEA